VDDVSIKTFFDQQGAPVSVAIHVVEHNTVTNSVVDLTPSARTETLPSFVHY